jgi:hypothetical protein
MMIDCPALQTRHWRHQSRIKKKLQPVSRTQSERAPGFPLDATGCDDGVAQTATYASEFAAIEHLWASHGNSGIAPLVATGPTFPLLATGDRNENV